MVHTRTVTSVQINGPALRAIRERSGVSCSALARAVGCDVSFLARVERGEKRGVNSATFERIARELHLADWRALLVQPYRPVTGVTGTTLGPTGPTVVPCPCSTRKAA